jgi:hypothetical protein
LSYIPTLNYFTLIDTLYEVIGRPQMEQL